MTTQQNNEPDRPRKKFERSTSPRAVERRRLQNRIAQRNHRRKIREQSGSVTDDQPRANDQNTTALEQQEAEQQPPIEPVETRDHQPSGSVSPTLKAQWSSMVEDGNEGGQMPALDPMMFHMPGNSTPNPYNFPMASFCGCNGATGPCARHLDEIRSQLFQSTQHFSRQNSRPNAGFNSPVVHPMHDTVMEENFGNMEHLRHTQVSDRAPLSMSLPTPGDEFPPFLRSSVDTTGSSIKSSKNSTRSPASSKSSYAPSTRQSNKSMQSGERSASSEPPPSDASDSRSRNTRRLTPILEAVQEAGFPDIDSMIAAYYSSSFEKNSFPDMAQKASRSRRLSKLLVELHEISDSWPKWQSRMFREGIMECARKICNDELETTTKSFEAQPDGEDASGYLSASAAVLTRTNSGMGNNSDRMGNPLAQLGYLPDHLESAIQNEAMHTWSLFTELAGAQGLYCDRVSYAVMALLVDSRRAQLLTTGRNDMYMHA